MIFTFPWPDARLTPNAKRRKHWSFYRPAIQSDRNFGWITVNSALGHRLSAFRKTLGGEGHLPCQIRFYPPDRRRRDDDGMIAAFKHMRDGMCDALKIDDYRLRPEYSILPPEKPGRVEVEL